MIGFSDLHDLKFSSFTFMKNLQNAKDCAEILRRLRKIKPDSRRLWGKMSAHQMICHLSDAFRCAVGEKQAARAGGIFQHTIMKWLALNLPLRAPRNYPTLPEADQEIGGTQPVNFDSDMAELLRLINRFTAKERDFKLPPHPIFGKMSEREWFRRAYMHTNHHLKQFGV